MILDSGFQALEPRSAVLRRATVWVAHDRCEDRHGAAVDIDEGLCDDEVDDLVERLASREKVFQNCAYPHDEVIRDMVPSLVELQ